MYSFGVLLWAMYTGWTPASHSSMEQRSSEDRNLCFPKGAPQSFVVSTCDVLGVQEGVHYPRHLELSHLWLQALANDCMAENPVRRPSAEDVLKRLDRIKVECTSPLSRMSSTVAH